jgi:MFS family permease
MSSYELTVPQETTSTITGTKVVLAATLTMAMGFGGLALISVFMRPMEVELGWTRSDTSLGYAFATLGMAVGGLIWGRLSDRIDVRPLLALGGAGMVSSLLVMYRIHSLLPFYFASLVYGGLGFSVLYSPLVSTSGEWFPQRRGLVMGIVTAGGALGQGLLPFVANILIAGFGWRAAFVAIAGVKLATFALCLPLLRWPGGTRAPSSTSAASEARASGGERLRIALLALAAFLCCVCMGVPLVHMVTFVGMICASPAMGVTSLLVAMICGTIGRVGFGVLADRIGALPSYAIASAMQMSCVLLFPAFADGVSLLALSALFGFGFAGNMTCVSLCVRQVVPANRFGGALGIVMMVAWGGMASGGYVGGLLFDASLSYTLSFVLAGIAGAFNLLVLAVLGAMSAAVLPATNPSATRASASSPRCPPLGFTPCNSRR